MKQLHILENLISLICIEKSVNEYGNHILLLNVIFLVFLKKD